MRTLIPALILAFLFSCASFPKVSEQKYLLVSVFDAEGRQETVVHTLAWAISERAILTNICGFDFMFDGVYEGVNAYFLYIDEKNCARGYLLEEPVEVSDNLPPAAEPHKKYFLESIKEAGGVDEIIRIFGMKFRGVSVLEAIGWDGYGVI